LIDKQKSEHRLSTGVALNDLWKVNEEDLEEAQNVANIHRVETPRE
tara:strand:+ start:1545 stop:1682 length:138 start_codon:yes stop_codon:yes gene_type:complete